MLIEDFVLYSDDHFESHEFLAKHVFKSNQWTLSTAMKFRPKFFWKWSFFDPNQQPLKSVEPFERNLRALFISTLSTALNLVHWNSCPKLANFPSYFSQLCNFPGEATFEKHADPEKKNWNSRKSHANSRNLLEPFLRSRKEENLYGHCAMNNAGKILSNGFTLLRGCWFWSKKLLFRKNFDENFDAVERVTMPVKILFFSRS